MRFLDGRSARPHPAEARVEGGQLIITADGLDHVWSLKRLTVDRHGGEVRVSHASSADARLILSEDDWRTLIGPEGARLEQRSRIRHGRLAVVLTLAAAGIVGFVFWGVPALSGPLARATPPSLEARMGRTFEAQISTVFRRCEGAEGQAVLARLGRRIAAEADTPFDIRVSAVEAPMVNAFAFPGGPIMVTDELIEEAESPDELAAVIAHEVAHIERRHSMQAVWRSLGLGILLDAVVGGGTGAGQQAVLLAGQATDLRYGREAETEADRRGQELLHASGLSSRGMAPFFARLAAEEGRPPESAAAVAEFLSSHPDTARRVRAARQSERPGAAALTPQEWASVRAACPERKAEPVERLKRRLGMEATGETPPEQ